MDSLPPSQAEHGVEQAQEHLTTAATMYREMGMGFWLERAETEAKAFG